MCLDFIRLWTSGHRRTKIWANEFRQGGGGWEDLSPPFLFSLLTMPTNYACGRCMERNDLRVPRIPLLYLKRG